MSNHGNLRKDKTCLNCRHVVENKFCPNCGQKNEDTRKTFHHLFVHFFEDLTHYENAFWRTIKNLLLKPASLTKEYLSGKRLSYLAPVRLYLFISFITFFIITVFTNKNDSLVNFENSKSDKLDTLENIENPKKIKISSEYFESVRKLDSIQMFVKEEDKLSDLQYSIFKKIILVFKNNTPEEIVEKFFKSFVSNFCKALFFYMPLFAFFLWLFHNKNKWYYFDHGIFTLHYFSFLLLVTLILFLVNKFFNLFGDSAVVGSIISIFQLIGFLWMIYYFFAAHHRLYEQRRVNSFLKSLLIFIINFVLILILLILFTIYTFVNIH